MSSFSWSRSMFFNLRSFTVLLLLFSFLPGILKDMLWWSKRARGVTERDLTILSSSRVITRSSMCPFSWVAWFTCCSELKEYKRSRRSWAVASAWLSMWMLKSPSTRSLPDMVASSSKYLVNSSRNCGFDDEGGLYITQSRTHSLPVWSSTSMFSNVL